MDPWDLAGVGGPATGPGDHAVPAVLAPAALAKALDTVDNARVSSSPQAPSLLVRCSSPPSPPAAGTWANPIVVPQGNFVSGPMEVSSSSLQADSPCDVLLADCAGLHWADCSWHAARPSHGVHNCSCGVILSVVSH